ncbi:uncharacterized protein At2g33490-like isoform X2 [Malania oleifera]|uniref:uncharacterized protein At2g33490-like isoform X2 n=1 Tax=Malania oleifera TaxID=397392 RepID=UPI0025ADCA8E|nr:uncharacterized protein At2g33490-like isoform X2 [Malania oleifera]
MRTSLKKLRGFALHHRHDDSKYRQDVHPSGQAQCDELAEASQDMYDMRGCYDSLLSAAAATVNCAYEFSESLREMGTCLLEKTALNDDEESGKVLLMLGKVQFQLQRLIDSYRSHIVQTITIPSESLLNELRTVEEMKRQCDEKRNVYEDMVTRHRDRGRSRCAKGEMFFSEQLQAAQDEYDEEATLFVFRLKSLKEGQSRSLLTQAARHHAAQLCFFRKGLKSLEAVEPHVRMVTEREHIDYNFTGLEDDGEDGDDSNDDEDSYDALDDGELSFNYGLIDQGQNVSASRNLREEKLVKSQGDVFLFSKELKVGSQSAPLIAEKKLDLAERMGQMRSSSRKFHTYVLPTPIDPKNSVPSGSGNSVPRKSGHNLSHSSPLEPKKLEKIFGEKKLSGSPIANASSILRESNNNIPSTQLPPPSVDGFSLPQLNPCVTSYSEKFKRQAFSGPLMRSTKSFSPADSPLGSIEQHQLFSGPILRNPASPSFVSSPRISELHELPRPPANFNKSERSSGFVGHSAPLVHRHQVLSTANEFVVSNAASPLPTPPQILPRCFSIPSGSQRMTVLQVPQQLIGSQNLAGAEDIASPPLTPLSLSNIQLASTASVTVISACQIKDEN